MLMLLASPIIALAGNEASGTITMEFDLSTHSADQETKLWVPYPL